jgi:predicted transposase YdaD
MDARYAAKWKLIQLLYRRGWDKQRIIGLFLVLDWMMRLPEHLKQALWQNIYVLEENEKMRYVSSVEQIGIEKGMQLGRLQGVQQGMQQGMQQGEALALQRLLSKRFGVLPANVAAQIAGASVEDIERWFDLAIEAKRLNDVFGVMDSA